MTNTGIAVNVTRNKLTIADVTLIIWTVFALPVVAFAWAVHCFEITFEGVLATLGLTADFTAETEQERGQVEAEAQRRHAPEVVPIIWENRWISCLRWEGLDLGDGFYVEIGGLAEWFQTNGMSRREQDVRFFDQGRDSLPRSISFAGRWVIRGWGHMVEVYTQLKKTSMAALIRYEEEEAAVHRSVFEESVNVADYTPLADTGDNKCPICLELFESSTCEKPISETHLAVEVKCGKRHVFGASCIWEWMNGCRENARDRCCPICCKKLEIPNCRWDADHNWLRSHLDQRRYLKQRRLENADHQGIYAKDRRHHLIYKILMPGTEWIDLLVDTIAALEVPESDNDVVEAMEDAQALLCAFASLADRFGWPEGVSRYDSEHPCLYKILSWKINRKVVYDLRKTSRLFALLCGTIDQLSLMGRALLPYREVYGLDVASENPLLTK